MIIRQFKIVGNIPQCSNVLFQQLEAFLAAPVQIENIVGRQEFPAVANHGAGIRVVALRADFDVGVLILVDHLEHVVELVSDEL